MILLFSYPFCGSASPADMPITSIKGEPIAPVLNTLPAETLVYQTVSCNTAFMGKTSLRNWVGFQNQLVTSPADFPQPVINDEPVAPVLNTVPEQTRAHEEHLLISQQQQLEQVVRRLRPSLKIRTELQRLTFILAEAATNHSVQNPRARDWSCQAFWKTLNLMQYSHTQLTMLNLIVLL